MAESLAFSVGGSGVYFVPLTRTLYYRGQSSDSVTISLAATDGQAGVREVVVPELVQGELPHKLYLPLVIRNSEGTGGGAPQVGPGFYLTHPIPPNQQSIT